MTLPEKEARKRIGYSLKDAAKKSEIKVGDIYAFKEGMKVPLYGQLCKLAEIYQWDISYFLSDDLLPEKEIFV